jgi:hypothetical protein
LAEWIAYHYFVSESTVSGDFARSIVPVLAKYSGQSGASTYHEEWKDEVLHEDHKREPLAFLQHETQGQRQQEATVS